MKGIKEYIPMIIKKLICKIFGHFDKTETDLVVETLHTKTYNYKHTCKICGDIRKGGYTCF